MPNMVRFKYCIIGSNRGKSDGNSGGTLLTGRMLSYHHNLCNSSVDNAGQDGERFPLMHHNYGTKAVAPLPDADIRNNFIYTWGRDNGTGSGYGAASMYNANSNIVNNYLYTKTGQSISDGITLNAYNEPAGNAYIAGNVSGNGYNYNAKSNIAERTVPAQYKIPVETACQSASKVLAKAGIPQRNPADGKRRADEQTYVNPVTSPNCQ